MKNKIKENIFSKHFDGNKDVYFSDLPKDLKDNDIIEMYYEEPYYSENNSHDGYILLNIFREREETDEEYNKRIHHANNTKLLQKKNRYERYLELKKEFENNELE